MAGLYAVIGECERRRIESAAERLRYFADESRVVIHEPGFGAAWVAVDDAADWAPAHDPRTGVRLLTSGRVALEEQEWREASELVDLEGGVANRLLLDRYLEGGVAAIERHNGPAAVLVWEPRERIAHLLTDHFGYHPVYLCRPRSAAPQIVSTSTDAIADDGAASPELDELSMVEFLSAWRTTPPHTYYRQVRHAGAARHWSFAHGAAEGASREYWRPFEQQPFASLGEARDALVAALERAIRIRTLPRLGPVVSFTGGGLDARAVLFAAADPAHLIAFNIYDRPNRETAIASDLCRRSAVRYVGFARDTDYYPRLMLDGVRLSNGIGSLEDHHYLGAREAVMALGARTVISACTTDWLFKGYGLEKAYRRLLGKNLPLERLTVQRIDAFLPNRPRPVPASFSSAVQGRLGRWFEGTPHTLREERDWLLVEDRRVRPACYAVSVSGPAMYRMFPYDTFLADRALADCYARMPARWKLHSRAWGLAVRRLGGRAGNVPDAAWGWRPGASSFERLAVFARGWLGRRLLTRRGAEVAGPAQEGSWPDFGWYARHSKTLEDLWQSTSPEHRQRMTRYWGSDPWRRSLTDWSASPHDLFRILTLLCWWRQRGV